MTTVRNNGSVGITVYLEKGKTERLRPGEVRENLSLRKDSVHNRGLLASGVITVSEAKTAAARLSNVSSAAGIPGDKD